MKSGSLIGDILLPVVAWEQCLVKSIGLLELLTDGPELSVFPRIMKVPHLRSVNSTQNVVLLAWSPEAILTSSGSSSSLLQKTPRQSRTALFSEERKISKSTLSVVDPPAVKKCDGNDESQGKISGTPPQVSKNEEWYTLQKKDRLLGWSTVYWGYKNEKEVSGLAPGEAYQFRIKASTKSECSDWSKILTVATKDDIVSAASLHRALDNSHMTSARKVLALRPQTLEIPNRMGRTSLAVAARRGDTSIASMLLTCGADVNAREVGSNRTPLMTATSQGLIPVINVLKEREAAWDLTDRFGQTALHYATSGSELHAVRIAVKESANVNVKDNYGWTPLVHAVILRAPPEVLEYLIENGSDVNISDKKGLSVLMQAILAGSPEHIELLLKYGADVEKLNIHGHTAYDLAKASADKATLKFLPLLECKISSPPKIVESLQKKKKQR